MDDTADIGWIGMGEGTLGGLENYRCLEGLCRPNHRLDVLEVMDIKGADGPALGLGSVVP